jgi:hypothetical protein
MLNELEEAVRLLKSICHPFGTLNPGFATIHASTLIYINVTIG